MANARFQIFSILIDPSRLPEPRFGGEPTRAPNGPVSWRLLAANNRSCGQATEVFASHDLCLERVYELRARIGSGQIVTRHDGAGLGWSWRIRVDDADVAVSSRRYQRRIRAEYAGQAFAELVPRASVTRVAGGGRFALTETHGSC